MTKTFVKHLAAIFAIFLAIVFVGQAIAADKLIEAPVQSVVSKLDKNGNPYTRIIVAQERELAGVSYTAGVPLMCFGEMADAGAQFKKGDTVRAIVNEREYRGNPSYTLISIVAE